MMSEAERYQLIKKIIIEEIVKRIRKTRGSIMTVTSSQIARRVWGRATAVRCSIVKYVIESLGGREFRKNRKGTRYVFEKGSETWEIAKRMDFKSAVETLAERVR